GTHFGAGSDPGDGSGRVDRRRTRTGVATRRAEGGSDHRAARAAAAGLRRGARPARAGPGGPGSLGFGAAPARRSGAAGRGVAERLAAGDRADGTSPRAGRGRALAVRRVAAGGRDGTGPARNAARGTRRPAEHGGGEGP